MPPGIQRRPHPHPPARRRPHGDRPPHRRPTPAHAPSVGRPRRPPRHRRPHRRHPRRDLDLELTR
ncbi:hypothetical protein CP974_05990 [Streptomyces fradiae ATCC 10745 = DSM 40063]|nr:hypothetical protein CP974_05990 [Streptomyces fradiae ATCC 10745 = DSM 40063]